MKEPTLDDCDQRSIVQFIRDTRQLHKKPSIALKHFASKNPEIWEHKATSAFATSSALTFQLLRLAYPEICDDLRFNIIDSNFPEYTNDLNFDNFDKMIEEKLTNHYRTNRHW